MGLFASIFASQVLAKTVINFAWPGGYEKKWRLLSATSNAIYTTVHSDALYMPAAYFLLHHNDNTRKLV